MSIKGDCAAAVSFIGIKTLLANGLSTFFNNSKPVFSNGSKSLPRYPPDYLILCYWVFDNFILADEPFAKALPTLETCVLVNKNLCRKLFPSLESVAVFNESFYVTSVPFSNLDFNLLSCEWDNFTFYGVILSHFILILY